MDRSPLGKLPAELRLYIYELAFEQPDTMVFIRPEYIVGLTGASLKYKMVKKDTDRHPLALTQTCRQIHNESFGLFFKVNPDLHLHYNHFRFPAESIDEFFNLIGPDASAVISTIEIETGGPSDLLSWGNTTDRCFRYLANLRQWSLDHPQISLLAEIGLRMENFRAEAFRATLDMRHLSSPQMRGGKPHGPVLLARFQRMGEWWIEELRKIRVEAEV